MVVVAAVVVSSTGSPLAERVRVGAFVHRTGSAPADPGGVLALESQLGRRLDITHDFFAWGRPFTEALTPLVPERDLMLSWKPAPGTMWSIAKGEQDAYIDRFAADAAAYGHPVHLRLAYEMNGDWNSYSAAAGGPPAPVWVESWQRVVQRFRAAGASNVRFVWCPNETDFPSVDGNRMEDYWPGADHVDVLGVDAYNWSTRSPRRGDGQWRTFEEVLAEPYARLQALPGAEGMPVWLCEFGTTEAGPSDPAGASKEQWFRDMFATRGFPHLEAVVYFSEDDQRDVQRDWRLETSAASIAGFREGWAQGG